MLSSSPTSSLCPSIELSIVNSDDSPLDGVVFTFNQMTHEFTIDSQDINDAGSYNMKVVASFSGGTYIQTEELEFTSILVDYCDSVVLTNPGGQPSTTTPADYYYTGGSATL